MAHWQNRIPGPQSTFNCLSPPLFSACRTQRSPGLSSNLKLMPQQHPEDFTGETANCLPTEASRGREITPRGLMPQVPLYIPVLTQHFVSLLYFVCIGKKTLPAARLVPRWGMSTGEAKLVQTTPAQSHCLSPNIDR